MDTIRWCVYVIAAMCKKKAKLETYLNCYGCDSPKEKLLVLLGELLSYNVVMSTENLYVFTGVILAQYFRVEICCDDRDSTIIVSITNLINSLTDRNTILVEGEIGEYLIDLIWSVLVATALDAVIADSKEQKTER